MSVDHEAPIVGRTPCAALEEELRAGPGADQLQALVDDFLADMVRAIARSQPRRPRLLRPAR